MDNLSSNKSSAVRRAIRGHPCVGGGTRCLSGPDASARAHGPLTDLDPATAQNALKILSNTPLTGQGNRRSMPILPQFALIRTG